MAKIFAILLLAAQHKRSFQALIGAYPAFRTLSAGIPGRVLLPSEPTFL
ncbi:hypothetical protein [Methyloglobulus morosus]|nr:hypothetical protein [Methyloglobulus morosus]